MTDEPTYDLSAYALADHEHGSGCPANPARQDPEVVRGEDEEAFVQRGVTPSGEPILAKAWVPGPPMVRVRCLDCSAQRLFNLNEDELLGLKVPSNG